MIKKKRKTEEKKKSREEVYQREGCSKGKKERERALNARYKQQTYVILIKAP